MLYYLPLQDSKIKTDTTCISLIKFNATIYKVTQSSTEVRAIMHHPPIVSFQLYINWRGCFLAFVPTNALHLVLHSVLFPASLKPNPPVSYPYGPSTPKFFTGTQIRYWQSARPSNTGLALCASVILPWIFGHVFQIMFCSWSIYIWL